MAGGMVPAASKATTPQGSLQESVASRIASEARERAVGLARTGAAEKIGPGALHPVAPAKDPHERADDEPVEGWVELPSMQPRPIQPSPQPAGDPPPGRAFVAPEVPAHGVLQGVV